MVGAHISVPMYQRSLDSRYRMAAGKCAVCGGLNFPPKGVCRHCRRGTVFTQTVLSGQGTIHSFTVISGAGAPPEFSSDAKCRGSYPVVWVDLAEGPRVIGQLVGPYGGELRIGARVETVFRRLYTEEGVIRYGFKFCLAED